MLRNILFSILIITIISNLIKILSECYNLKLGKSKKFEHFRTCSPGQGPNGLSGYQCTLGCGGGTGDMARYPYTSKEQAGDVCRARGFRGLCTRKEVTDAGKSEKLNQCCNGWTLDGGATNCKDGACGWYQSDARPGCGHNWNTWNRTEGAGAHCCGESPASTDLRRTKKSMLITQTKLAKAEALLHKFDGAKEEIDNMRNEMRVRQNRFNARINADAIKCQREQQDAAAAATAEFNKKYKFQGEEYQKSKDQLKADHAKDIANREQQYRIAMLNATKKANVVIDAAKKAIDSDLSLIEKQRQQIKYDAGVLTNNALVTYLGAYGLTNPPNNPPSNEYGIEPAKNDKSARERLKTVINTAKEKQQKNKSDWDSKYTNFKNMGRTVINDNNKKS